MVVTSCQSMHTRDVGTSCHSRSGCIEPKKIEVMFLRAGSVPDMRCIARDEPDVSRNCGASAESQSIF